jgi:hypothetical protein
MSPSSARRIASKRVGAEILSFFAKRVNHVFLKIRILLTLKTKARTK